MSTTNRRECRAADLRLWPLLYWTTDPTRLPPECAHLSGTPVERYHIEWLAYGTVAVRPKYESQDYDPSAFDVEDR